MKYIFVTPVTAYYDMMPLPGIPELMGILEDNAIECEYYNLNGRYVEYLNQEKIEKYYQLLDEFYEKEEYEQFPIGFRKSLIKYKTFYRDKTLAYKRNIKNFDFFKKIFKVSKLRYSHNLYAYYTNLLSFVKNENLLFHCSLKISNDKEFSINIEEILFFYNSRLNNLKEFYEKQAEYLIKSNPDVIGIQITNPQDFLSGIFLSYTIKQKNPKVYINIGGNYFEMYYKKISNLKDLFGTFFDSISIGKSDNTVVQIIKYLKKEIHIEQVSNLIYLKNDNIEKNNLNREEINVNPPFQSFNGYKKEDYLLPELVLPIRASSTYSCYWGKCIYCDCAGRKNEYIPMSAKRFVEELEYLSKTYNTKHFAFWDNSLHPIFLEKVANLLIEKKLNIKYSLFARLEKEFTLPLMKKLNKSGCVMIHWGLDSASDRILKYINKGVDINTAKLVLKNAHKAGIYNYLYIIFGYPTETVSEMSENLKFIEKNYRNIDEVRAIDELYFVEGSILNNDYEYYNKLINRTKEFEQSKRIIIAKIKKKMKNINIHDLWVYLYISKYGKFRYSILKGLINYNITHNNKLVRLITNINYKLQIKKAKYLTNNIV